MQTREYHELAIKLGSVLKSIDSSKLTEFADAIEESIINNSMLDDADKNNLQKSYNKQNKHYQIETTDKEIIKTAKAVINLVRSLERTYPTVIKPTIDILINEAQYDAGQGAASLLSLAANFGVEKLQSYLPSMFKSSSQQSAIDQALQLKDDIQAFTFFTRQLGGFAPQITGLNEESKRMLASLQGVLENRNVVKSANEMTLQSTVLGGAFMTDKYKIGKSISDSKSDTGYSVTLSVVQKNIFNNISEADKKRFYDEKNDRFNVTDIKQGVKPDDINLMVAYNASNRARKSLNTINHFIETWKKTGSLPVSQLPDMIELINKMGKVVGDINNLNTEKLSEQLREDLFGGIKELLENVGPILPQLASIAQETELRAGLKDNSILSSLENVCASYASTAIKYGLKPAVNYPYSAEKNNIIKRLSAECDNRIAALYHSKETLGALNGELAHLIDANTPKLVSVSFLGQAEHETPELTLPTLVLLKKLQQAALSINTMDGSSLSSMTTKMINAFTGSDALEIDITKAERKVAEIFEALERRDADRINYSLRNKFVPFHEDPQMAAALNDVKKLYALRDELSAGDKDQHYETSRSGVGNLHDGLIKPDKINNLLFEESMESIARNLQKSSVSAAADIDDLISLQESKKHNMQSHAAKVGKSANLNTIATMQSAEIGKQKNVIQRDDTARKRENSKQNAMKLKAVGNKISMGKQKMDDPFMISIVERGRGSVITACEKAKNYLFEQCSVYLTEGQCMQLGAGALKDGLYEASKWDGLIVANVKNTCNTLTMVSRLMKKINTIQDMYAAGGVENKKNILRMMPELIADTKIIASELEKSNQSLISMREFIADSGGENIAALSQIYDGFSQHLSSDLRDMLPSLNEVMLMAGNLDFMKEKGSVLMSQCTGFLANIDAFARNNNPRVISSLVGNATFSAKGVISIGKDAVALTDSEEKIFYDTLNSVVAHLESELAVNLKIHKRNDGTFDLSKFTKGSKDYKVAAGINAAIASTKTLVTTEKIARKNSSTILGGINFLSTILPLLNAIKELGPNETINAYMKSLLENIEPSIIRAYASSALTEKALGTENLLTSQIDSRLVQYFELAKKFGAELKGTKPYVDMQHELAGKHLSHLDEQRNQRAESLSGAKEQLTSLDEQLTNLIEVGTPKLVNVSILGQAEYETSSPALPSLAQLRIMHHAASAIPTHAGRSLVEMTEKMMRAVTGLEHLENDISKARSVVDSLNEERESLKKTWGSLGVKREKEFENAISNAEVRVRNLENIHQTILQGNNNQHYISAKNGNGSLQSGLIIPDDIKKLGMGTNVETVLGTMQKTLKAASADVTGLISADTYNLKCMQTILEIAQREKSEPVTPSRRH